MVAALLVLAQPTPALAAAVAVIQARLLLAALAVPVS
jgi:hypothetical protein